MKYLSILWFISSVAFSAEKATNNWDIRFEENTRSELTTEASVNYKVSKINRKTIKLGGGITATDKEGSNDALGLFGSISSTEPVASSLSIDHTVNFGMQRFSFEQTNKNQDALYLDLKMGIHHETEMKNFGGSLFTKVGAGFSKLFPTGNKDTFDQHHIRLEQVYPYLAAGISL